MDVFGIRVSLFPHFTEEENTVELQKDLPFEYLWSTVTKTCLQKPNLPKMAFLCIYFLVGRMSQSERLRQIQVGWRESEFWEAR